MMSDDHNEFEQRIKHALDASVTDLDAGTRNRLAAMRRQALGQPSSWFAWRPSGIWAPATAMAFCIALSFMLFFNTPASRQEAILAQQEQTAIVDMMTSEDGLEGEPDPAFYVWVNETLADKGTGHES